MMWLLLASMLAGTGFTQPPGAPSPPPPPPRDPDARRRGTREEEDARKAAERAEEVRIWGERGRPTSPIDPRLHLARKDRPPAGIDRVVYVGLLRQGFTKIEALEVIRLNELPAWERRELFDQVVRADSAMPDDRRALLLGIFEKIAGE